MLKKSEKMVSMIVDRGVVFKILIGVEFFCNFFCVLYELVEGIFVLVCVEMFVMLFDVFVCFCIGWIFNFLVFILLV